MNFLTSGQKIRKIRKYLGMNQKDLESQYASRAYISMIEKDKRNLNETVASDIYNKFEKKAKENKIDLNINTCYFLKPPMEDAKEYCMDLLSHENLGDKEFKEILDTARSFNLKDVEASAQCRLADMYTDNKRYEDAFNSYNAAIDIYKELRNNDIIPYLYWQLGNSKAKSMFYLEALSYFKLCEQYNKLNSSSLKDSIFLYSIANCYKRLDNIPFALKYIERYLKVSDRENNFKFYFYANILKANCHQINKEFEKAIEIYDLLISQIENSSPLMGFIYNNLGTLHHKKQDFKKSIHFFKLAEDLRSRVDKKSLSHTLIEKSIVWIEMGLLYEAEKTLKEGINKTAVYNDIEYMIKGKFALSDVYEKLKDYESLESLYFEILELLGSEHISNTAIIYSKFSSLYIEQNRLDEAKKYQVLLQEILQKKSTLYFE